MADADAIRDAGIPVTVGTPEAEPPAPHPPRARDARGRGDDARRPPVELRDRLVKVVLVVALTSLVGFYFTKPIIGLLVAPLPNKQLQFTGVGDAFFINVKIAIVVGIILAMPVILYQLWAFIAPGLTDDEQRTVRPWIPIALAVLRAGRLDRLRDHAVRDGVPAAVLRASTSTR